MKTKRWEDKDGKKREETKSTFGYKACFNVDDRQPVIIEVQTVTGSKNDQLLSTPMLEGAGPEQMQKMIGEKCDEILRAMLEEYKKIDEIELDE